MTQRASDLDTAVRDVVDRYVAARPLSREWAERARSVLPGGNTRSVLHVDPFPIRIARAAGARLVDVDGYEYVDLLGDYTAGFLGHSPGPVLAAATRALESGWSFGGVHRDEVRLAELIVDRFDSIDQVRFTNSGTEANLMALALALHHASTAAGRPRRTVVVFEHGYHGGVLTFGDGPSAIDVPHDWLVLPYNDADAVVAAFSERGDDIGAVLVEPMQGSSGCFPGDPSFLGALRECCDQSDAVLIFDEVMTSRLARGGAQELLGVRADLTTLGKHLGGGLSFGAFGGARAIMAHFDPAAGGTLGHAGTFNNNVATMAGGVAALTEVLTIDRQAATNQLGDRLRVELDATFAEHGVPMCATGTGSLLNVHATPGPVRTQADLAAADERWKTLFYFDALDAGFHFARRGFIALSIEITGDDVTNFVGFASDWSARAATYREE